MSEWRKSTCERCVFRVGDQCRRFPPSFSLNSFIESGFYQVVVEEKRYSPACAEYAELIEPPKTTDDNGTV